MNDITNIYNFDYNITYHLFDHDKSDTQYRKELLDVFYLTVNEFDSINNKIDNLFQLIPKNNKKMNDILDKLSSKFFSEDKDFGFMILFSYDTFHIIHRLLQNFLKTNELNNEILQELEKNI